MDLQNTFINSNKKSHKNNLKKENLKKNFFSKVKKTGFCWVWTGKRRKDGYGVMTIDSKQIRAHRVSFKLFNKKTTLSPQQKILHTCDNPCCVNPKHLILGTQADNMLDMIQKGRNAWFKSGYKNPRAMFKPKDIADIFHLAQMGWKQKDIANKYRCRQQTISRILNKKRYA